MITRRTTITITLLTIILSLLLAACSPSAPEEQVTLRMAVLPIMDALPMYVAQQEGLFEENGVKVEFIPVASAAERDQVIAAGQADGMINETVSTLFYNEDETQIQIVRFARVATPENPLFRILASGQSGITTPEGLKGVEIGISQGTVIEYLTDRLLQAEGFSPDEIKTIAVPKIPDRMALLASGELDAAMLPDPLSFLAMDQGAVIVVDDSENTDYSYSTISFVKPVITEHPEVIRGFLAAIEAATELINADPAKWDGLLSEQNLVPAPLIGTFRVSSFPSASVPSEAQWQDAMEWAQGKEYISTDVSYSDSVNASLLP